MRIKNILAALILLFVIASVAGQQFYGTVSGNIVGVASAQNVTTAEIKPENVLVVCAGGYYYCPTYASLYMDVYGIPDENYLDLGAFDSWTVNETVYRTEIADPIFNKIAELKSNYDRDIFFGDVPHKLQGTQSPGDAGYDSDYASVDSALAAGENTTVANAVSNPFYNSSVRFVESDAKGNMYLVGRMTWPDHYIQYFWANSQEAMKNHTWRGNYGKVYIDKDPDAPDLYGLVNDHWLEDLRELMEEEGFEVIVDNNSELYSGDGAAMLCSMQAGTLEE